MEILYVIVLAAALFDLLLELKRVLMLLQQNSYRNDRHMRWLRSSEDTTSYTRLISLAVFVISLSTLAPSFVSAILILIFSLANGCVLARAKYKKPLVFTRRACRIYALSLVLALLVAVAAVFALDLYSLGTARILYSLGVVLLLMYVVSHVILMLANRLLAPVEKLINKRYYHEAARILASMPGLKVIGITGSYGKTSTKHFLHRILSEKYDVAMTPGSYNTTLGVVRTVRETLKPYNEVFIVEMGAKQPGDIREICDLVHPSIGIVTAVGEQHLESFKTIENVQKTKFELIDALPPEGIGVVNNDFAFAANREVKNVRCLRYGVNAGVGADYTVEGTAYTEAGTLFTIVGRGLRLDLRTRLAGEANLSNLVAAVVTALELGVGEDKIKYAVEKIEPVEHRLNLRRTAAGITVIDDAFNSNPVGAAMALDLLARMDKGRRIVITPGMIELGERQFSLNEKLGEQIARCADIAIIVGQYNRQALLDGIFAGEMPRENCHAVDTFAQAQQLLSSMVSAGDAVLYENDLPDTFK